MTPEQQQRIKAIDAQIAKVEDRIRYASKGTDRSTLEKWQNELDNLKRERYNALNNR